MNIGSYESIFSQINEKRITFLDFVDYANQILNNGSKDLFLKPETFISVFTQAERLLSPEWLMIHVNPFYQSYLEKEGELLQSWKSKRTALVLKNILALEKPKTVLAEIVTAIKSISNKPIILMMDSPQKWLSEVKEAVNGNKQSSFSLDDFERVSMYMAELLRFYSTLGISGIVLWEDSQTTFSLDELLNSYQPIINVANHYKWPIGIQGELERESTALNEKIDFYLNSSLEIGELSPLWEKGLPVGGGLNRNFWTRDLQKKISAQKGLFFGKIPAGANPENVLAQLKMLRS